MIRETIGLSDEIKRKIEKLYKSGIQKPTLIIHNIRSAGLKEPNKRQISNYLTQVKKKFGGPAVVSLGDLAYLCDSLSGIPESDDEPFVLKHDIQIDDAIAENHQFRFLVTTKRLLTLLEYSSTLHTDATYKLIWQGFPVLVVGTSDRAKKFHAIGIAVTSAETEQDFVFLFEAIKVDFSKMAKYLFHKS
jgi:hypothetical protein